MKRIEIIITQAIEVDFIDYYTKLCKAQNCKCKFTKVDNVMGQGNTNPKMGDAIWPQLNVMFIIYCPDDLAPRISAIMDKLHNQYVGEGAAAFITEARELKS